MSQSPRKGKMHSQHYAHAMKGCHASKFAITMAYAEIRVELVINATSIGMALNLTGSVALKLASNRQGKSLVRVGPVWIPSSL